MVHRERKFSGIDEEMHNTKKIYVEMGTCLCRMFDRILLLDYYICFQYRIDEEYAEVNSRTADFTNFSKILPYCIDACRQCI